MKFSTLATGAVVLIQLRLDETLIETGSVHGHHPARLYDDDPKEDTDSPTPPFKTDWGKPYLGSLLKQ